jgi:iron complex outermembrane receptor protein
MTKKITLKISYLLLFLCFSIVGFAQETIVNGVVIDAITGETLPGATIIVKGKVLGTTADSNGEFNFAITLPPPFTLVFSSVGYELREYDVKEDYQELTVRLRSQVLIEADFVISASRFGESVLQSPSTVAKLDGKGLATSPQFNSYHAIVDFPGLQLNKNSLTFNAPNVRGFAGNSNPRMMQLIDGVDNAPPGLNFALGNLIGVSDLDIAEIELVYGPASALYGPNAFNGVLFMSTKSPFDYEGLSAYSKNGLTEQDAAGVNPFFETGIRYAKAINDVFAIKINASYFKGTDWHATDYSDVDQNPFNTEKGSIETNPSFDGVNIYGDEIATTLNLDALTGAPAGTFGGIRVARTGYREEDLTNYDAEQIKADMALHYRLTDAVELIGSYRFGTGQTVFQGANRYNFDNLYMNQFKLEMKSTDFFVRAYANLENSGDSYDMRFASWNVNRFWKADEAWFGEYAAAYLGTVAGVDSANHTAARAFADRDRLQPGSEDYRTALDSVNSLSDLTQGARFLDRSEMYHVEGQYDFSNYLSNMELQIGGNYRMFRLISDGTLFNDTEGNPIANSEYGAYLRGSFFFLEERLKLAYAVRYDKNQNFDGRITPRAAIIYSAGKDKEHNFRFSYQTGFRNPTTQNQFINLNVGVAHILGGVESTINNYSKIYALTNGTNVTLSGADIYNNSYTANSVQNFVTSGSPDSLVAATIPFVKPEKVTTFELGYRGIVNKRMFLDIHAYSNTYEDFIANTNVVTLLEGNVSDASGVAALAAGNSTVYQLATNATGTVTSIGGGIAFEYALAQGFRLLGNYNYASFENVDADAELLPGFNTPEHRFGLGLSNDNLVKGFGFTVRYNWSDGYRWQSAFGAGNIESFQTVNAQISYKIPNSKVVLKLGGNNILGQEYMTSFGTPNIGSIYYISFTFDDLNDF